MKRIVFAAAAMAAVFVASGKTTLFVGRADAPDGHLFSVAENWTAGLPVKDDSVCVSSVVQNVVNDLQAGLTLGSLSLKKNSTVDFSSELSGNPVVLTTSLYLYQKCKCRIDITAKANNFYLGGGSSGSCFGLIETTGNCLLYINNNESISLYGPLRVAGTIKSNSNASYRNGSLYLYATGNYFKTSKIWYNNLYFKASHAVDPEFVLDWGDTNKENKRGMYHFGSTDQTANRILGTLTRTTGCQIEGAGVLTLNGTADAITPCLLQDSISVVWAPSGDYTQTFTNRAHTTSGSLTVSNGTMRLAAGGSFKSVKRVVVAEGACFDLATPAAQTFKALTSLVVDGTFRFAVGAANPFSDATLTVDIGLAGKLEIPEGVSLSLPYVRAAGVYPKAGTYDATCCDWISGGGSVVVGNAALSSWRQPVSGSWSTALNWSNGEVPSSSPTYITAQGADYDVTFDAECFSPQEIYIGNSAGFASRLLVEDGAVLSETADTVFSVENGGVFEVSKGFVGLTNGANRLATVSGSGVWRVSGGTNEVMTREIGGFVLSNGGTLSVTSGLFRVKNTRYTYHPGLSLSGGRILLSGTGRFRSENSSGEFNPLGSGLVEVADHASVYLGRAFAGPKLENMPLEIHLKDNASFVVEAGLFLGDTLTGGSTDVSVDDNAKLDLGWKGGIGMNRPCRVKLDIKGAGIVVSGGYGCSIGGLVAKKGSSAAYPTGIVNVVSGVFNGGGHYYGLSNFANANHFQGVLIGSPDPSVDVPWTGEARYHGEIHIFSQGAYKNEGNLSIGIGNGDGLFNVAGGSARVLSGGETLVGACGGNGAIRVTDSGLLELSGALLVGGFEPSRLAVARAWSILDHETTASTGIVEAVDGTLRVSKDITLGLKGTGVLSIGSNGVVTARSLILTNGVAAKVSFTFGSNGIGSVKLSDTLVLSQGASLEVDASAYTGDRGFFRLIDTASVDGEFDPEKVLVHGLDGLVLKLDNRGIAVMRSIGTQIIVR